MNVKQFARLGGKARAEKLSKARRIEIASIAGKASAKARKQAYNIGETGSIDLMNTGEHASKSVKRANSQPNDKIPENKVSNKSWTCKQAR